MKAIVLYGVKDLCIEDIPQPQPKGDQVLVEIDQAGLCGTDVHMWAGTNFEGTFPFVPGHEWVGRVVEIGKDVQALAVGDRVTGEPFIGCRKCAVCRTGGFANYCPDHRYYGFSPTTAGGLAEYHCSPEERLHKVPSTISDDTAALIEPISVAYYGLSQRQGQATGHDRIGVFGAGPIGIFAMLISHAIGAETIVVEPQSYRQQMAKALGAQIVIDPSREDPVEAIMDLTKGLGLTRIMECSGSPEGTAMTVDVVAVNGIIVLTGQSVGVKIPIELGKILWKHASIVGYAGPSYFFPQTIAFLSNRSANFDKVITHRFSFDQALDAFELGNKGSDCGKIMMYSDAGKIPT